VHATNAASVQIHLSSINGGVSISGGAGSFGAPFDVTWKTLLDPDGNELRTNHINGGLNCSGNDPAPQQVDSEGNPNTVNGPKTGQCAGF
jgi:hypothetical protein